MNKQIISLALVLLTGACGTVLDFQDGIPIPATGGKNEDAGDEGGTSTSTAGGDAAPSAAALAARDVSCAERCVGSGRQCVAGVCEVTCAEGAECTGPVCPAGVYCVVRCAGDKACDDVACGDVLACSIDCATKQACKTTPVAAASSASHSD